MKVRTLLLIPIICSNGCSDYGLNTTEKVEEPGAHRVDTGAYIPDAQDTGTEPDIDTGNAPVPDTQAIDYELRLRLSADDLWEAWVDGDWVDQQEGWNQVSEYSYSLSSGPHVVAVRVDDLHLIINGFIAEVTIDGEIWSLTGEERWRVRDTEPTADWTLPGYAEGGWTAPVICDDDAPWSGNPTLVNPDAEWIWHHRDCRQELGTAWFRLLLELP